MLKKRAEKVLPGSEGVRRRNGPNNAFTYEFLKKRTQPQNSKKKKKEIRKDTNTRLNFKNTKVFT
jgi:hypothetical protein